MKEKQLRLLREKSKAEHMISEAKSSLKEANEKYTSFLIDQKVKELINIQNEEGILNEDALKLFLNSLVHDVLDTYNARR
ncbi:hypothetical protein O0R52_22260 (plasmid) [Bacillus halotolerans]|uniref:Uncharacterized protein n=1 Tax=Bacillus halotolerans TaxID=260554 RepID=A0ABY7I696_9BACI|nr:hypothetical protein [Bacillus halotolerans]WAT23508.1 hypothetical protein O0R52_22260 [Bacillus halotolerans]